MRDCLVESQTVYKREVCDEYSQAVLFYLLINDNALDLLGKYAVNLNRV